jgi:hypothetical protein
MIVTIHQPEHLVWLGLLHKIAAADIFVILDTVQFEKNYFQNRNKIRTAQGAQWLTVPVKKQPLQTEIKDIEIASTPWKEKYLRSLEQAYSKAPFFKTYYPTIKEIIERPHTLISELNCDILLYLLQAYEIQPKRIVRSSELTYEQPADEQVVYSICKALKPDLYLSGPSGRDYLRLEPFEASGIQVRFHEFAHPTYRQLHEPFMPYITSLELLFLKGSEARAILFNA